MSQLAEILLKKNGACIFSVSHIEKRFRICRIRQRQREQANSSVR